MTEPTKNFDLGDYFAPHLQIVMLILLIFLGALIGQLIGYGYAAMLGIDLKVAMSSLLEGEPTESRNFYRGRSGLVHFFTFFLPGVALVVFLFRKRWLNALNADFLPKIEFAILAPIFILICMPLVNLTMWLNKKIPLPDWMTGMEENAGELISLLLRMDTPIEYLFSLFIMALLPALGEEIVFRGILQKKIEQMSGNPHVAILVAAFVFSFIHFQFEGFFPRFFIGAILGYLFYWSRNLWIPILAHFVFNGIQVSAAYINPEAVRKTLENGPKELEPIAIFGAAIISAIFVFFLARFFHLNRVAD